MQRTLSFVDNNSRFCPWSVSFAECFYHIFVNEQYDRMETNKATFEGLPAYGFDSGFWILMNIASIYSLISFHSTIIDCNKYGESCEACIS